MKIRVFDNGGKTADRYTVLLDEDGYGMSEDANMPNGVCMSIWGEYVPGQDREIVLGELPKGTLVAIINILSGMADGLEGEIGREYRAYSNMADSQIPGDSVIVRKV